MLLKYLLIKGGDSEDYFDENLLAKRIIHNPFCKDLYEL